jgi:hypothetical protein
MERAMAEHINTTERRDPIFHAIEEQQSARAELLEASRGLDRAVAAVDAATERLAERERQLLATRPESKEGASALLSYLASVIEPPEDIAELALPALAGVRSVLLQ